VPQAAFESWLICHARGSGCTWSIFGLREARRKLGTNCVIATSMPRLSAPFFAARPPRSGCSQVLQVAGKVHLPSRSADFTLPSSSSFAHPRSCRAARLLCYGDRHLTHRAEHLRWRT
jgi:hypothetical protein